MSNSKLRKKLVLLKQILEDATSEKSTDSAMESHHSEEETAKRTVSKSTGISEGPAGRYPVKFSAPHKNKSCQTRLSSFPLFPVPEEIMWISDGEEKPKERRLLRAKKKKQPSKSKDAKNPGQLNDASKVDELKQLNTRNQLKNPDGTRKDFRSEHQLKDTSNPAILAWVYRKNIDARKKRREERRERRAKRLVLQEESRQKIERMIESEGRVREWFKMKRRQTLRSNRSKVSPQDERKVSRTDKASPLPPPGYTVVKSFKCSENDGLSQRRKKDSSLTEQVFIKQDANTGISAKPEEKELGSTRRPKTSVPRQKVRRDLSPQSARPKTARERISKQTEATNVNNENQSPRKMQSKKSYDEWLKNKRDEDKKRKTQKERELIDSHLEAVIAELGKQRVERILSPRKRVDTGLKNSNRSIEPSQLPISKGQKMAKYKWVSTKKPRPEPQGCDCPDSGQDDDVIQSHNVPETERTSSSEEKPVVADKTLEFCQEVDKKCDELKPSMVKVLSILDAEIKKQKGRPKKRKDQSISDDKYSVEAQRGSEVDSLDQGNLVQHLHDSGTLRPKSAKPRPVTVTAEQIKKIKSDMDVLGLCSSGSDDAVVNSAEKSTVRENYFDYGSDVDPPSMKPAKHCTAHTPSQDT